MNWNEFIYGLIVQHCERNEGSTFTLREFQKQNRDEIFGFSDDSKTPMATVRKILQQLRDDDFLVFENNRGVYSLRTSDLAIMKSALEERDIIETIRKYPAERREYVFEIFVRDVSWKRKAKEVFGLDCLLPECGNTFIKEDGTPYIEVHHIKPLYEGGEDNIGNLSVVCAHHHRMAHYANVQTREDVKKILLSKTKIS